MIGNLSAPVLLKTLGIVTLLLVASGAGNALLLRKLWIADVEHTAEVERLEQAATIAGLNSALDGSRALAAAAENERKAVVADFRAIALEQAAQTEQYWQRLRKIPPLPLVCAPGQARVDAFNQRENRDGKP